MTSPTDPRWVRGWWVSHVQHAPDGRVAVDYTFRDGSKERVWFRFLDLTDDNVGQIGRGLFSRWQRQQR